ncbi:MAG TPA: hypothetical protein VMM18_10560 [Gemmatimonadaceae bacterium]|nr:hypothetical protein [Gemmatimonadaceae bacterium]
MNTRILVLATTIGTAVQLAMVIAGHYNRNIAALFAVGGMTISLAAGLLYAIWARDLSLGNAALGGLLAGGICALIGIAVSYLLGDVQAVILALGTLSSAVTGALGGAIGWLVVTRLLASA